MYITPLFKFSSLTCLKAVNNLAVALLGQGKLREVKLAVYYTANRLHVHNSEQGIDVLETALKASPSSVVVAEPFLFNLCKLFFCLRHNPDH